MPDMDQTWLFVASVIVYALVLAVPGVAVGIAAGLRGWSLAGLTPVLGYAVLGLAGPWLNKLGLAWTVVSALAVTVLFAAVVYAARRALRRWRPQEPREHPKHKDWSRNAHLAVIACVLVGFAVSAIVVIGAAEGVLDAVSQRWDMVFHANGIRYIAETGDGGLYGVSSVNRYGPEGSQFYPNAYHLAGSLVYLVTGASVPLVLNAMTLPLAGIFALSMAALVRECGGRSVLAGAAALVAAVATNGAYESIANGLVPFALSTALMPLGPLVVHRYLTRPGFESGLILVLTSAGLLVVHSSALFAALLFAIPLLAHRWWTQRETIGPDLLRLVPIAAGGAALTAMQLLGALDQASGSYPYNPWASDKPVWHALQSLAIFRHADTLPQYVLTVFLIIGLLTYRRLNGLRWVLGAAVLFGTLWVLVDSYGSVDWVVAISRPWWNDRFRVMALAVIPLSLLAAHGMAETQRRLADFIAAHPRAKSAHPKRAAVVRLTAGAAVLALVGVVSGGFYASANANTVGHAFHKSEADKAGVWGKISVSPLEVEAMHRMGELTKPGERVMNDRNDGSVWLYAIAGVDAVASHYDPFIPPKDAQILGERFRDYETDPEVRAAVKRLNVRHVFVGDGSIYINVKPHAGLQGIENADFLTVVYRNPDATIYEIIR